MRRLLVVFLSLLLPLAVSSQGRCHGNCPCSTCDGGNVRTVAILGDSYSTFQGYIPEGNAYWYYVPGKPEPERTDVTDVTQTWWWILTHREGYKLGVNDSYSGATVSYTGYDGKDYSDRSFITRIPNLGHPDIILILGAINDSWAGVRMGEYKYTSIEREDLYTFRPAFSKLLHLALELYPDADIRFILSDGLREELNESVLAICDHYGIPCIRLEGIDKRMGHPTVKGMASIADQVIQHIETQ